MLTAFARSTWRRSRRCPRSMWLRSVAVGRHEAPASPTVLAALRAWGEALRGTSPDTRAVMPKAAQTPTPAAQDPRRLVPAVSSRDVPRPGSLDITASCVHGLADLSHRRRPRPRARRGTEPALRPFSAASFPPADCHRAVTSQTRGRPLPKVNGGASRRDACCESPRVEVSPSAQSPSAARCASWRRTATIFRSVFCAAVSDFALTARPMQSGGHGGAL